MDKINWVFENNHMTAYGQEGRLLRSWQSSETFGRFFVAFANQNSRLSRQLLWPLLEDNE